MLAAQVNQYTPPYPLLEGTGAEGTVGRLTGLEVAASLWSHDPVRRSPTESAAAQEPGGEELRAAVGPRRTPSSRSVAAAGSPWRAKAVPASWPSRPSGRRRAPAASRASRVRSSSGGRGEGRRRRGRPGARRSGGSRGCRGSGRGQDAEGGGSAPVPGRGRSRPGGHGPGRCPAPRRAAGSCRCRPPLDDHDRQVAGGHPVDRVAERPELRLAPEEARDRRQRAHQTLATGRPLPPPSGGRFPTAGVVHLRAHV